MSVCLPQESHVANLIVKRFDVDNASVWACRWEHIINKWPVHKIFCKHKRTHTVCDIGNRQSNEMNTASLSATPMRFVVFTRCDYIENLMHPCVDVISSPQNQISFQCHFVVCMFSIQFDKLHSAHSNWHPLPTSIAANVYVRSRSHHHHRKNFLFSNIRQIRAIAIPIELSKWAA